MVHVINNDFINILQPLTDFGWQFIKDKDNEIQMNKKYSELEYISVKYTTIKPHNLSVSSNVIHITLPIKNSVYSFYKRHTDLETSKSFLQNYVSDLL
jgi:hypothetical protein